MKEVSSAVGDMAMQSSNLMTWNPFAPNEIERAK